jgi:membrane associated rhomboid family serine protease
VAGALFYTLLSHAHIPSLEPAASMVGASAGVFGVLIGGAILAPNVMVMLLFPPIPMQLKYLAWGMVALAAYTVLFNGQNAGGQAAHLGGAGWGYLLIRHPQWLRWPWPPRRRPASRFWQP